MPDFDLEVALSDLSVRFVAKRTPPGTPYAWGVWDATEATWAYTDIYFSKVARLADEWNQKEAARA